MQKGIFKNKKLSFVLLILYFSLSLANANFCLAKDHFVYNDKGKRDPFIPLVTPDGRLLKLDKEEGTVGLLIEGIIYDEHGLSYAIVNGDAVKTGDRIGNYQVLKIRRDSIVFIKEGQPIELKLNKEGE